LDIATLNSIVADEQAGCGVAKLQNVLGDAVDFGESKG